MAQGRRKGQDHTRSNGHAEELGLYSLSNRKSQKDFKPNSK